MTVNAFFYGVVPVESSASLQAGITSFISEGLARAAFGPGGALIEEATIFTASTTGSLAGTAASIEFNANNSTVEINGETILIPDLEPSPGGVAIDVLPPAVIATIATALLIPAGAPALVAIGGAAAIAGVTSFVFSEAINGSALLAALDDTPPVSLVILDQNGNQVGGGVFPDGLPAGREIELAIDGSGGLLGNLANGVLLPLNELPDGFQLQFFENDGVFSDNLRESFTVLDGTPIVELADALGVSVRSITEGVSIEEPTAIPPTGPIVNSTTGFFRDAQSPVGITGGVENRFVQSGGQNFLFVAENDVLTLNIAGRGGTVDFSLTDIINGGSNLTGGASNNIIIGNDDVADNISGGGGSDLLIGRGGDDILSGDGGVDSLFGGEGADTFVAQGASGVDFVGDYDFTEGDALSFIGVSDPDGIEFSAVAGNLQVLNSGTGAGFVLDNVLTGSTDTGTVDIRVDLSGSVFEISLNRGDLSIESIRIEGTDGADILDGTPGNDELIGNGGVDIISGGEGDDHLDGGTENDTLTGGIGQDDFLFRTGDGADTIVDYTFGDSEAGNDILELLDIEGTDDLTSTRVAADGTPDAEGPSLLLGYGDAGDTIFLTDFFIRQTTDIRFIQVRFNGGEKDTRGEADLPELILVPIGADGAILADPEDAVMDITDPDPNGNEILGTESNDSLDGTGADETIRGLGGIDIINAVNAVNAVNDNDVTGVTLTLARGVA